MKGQPFPGRKKMGGARFILIYSYIYISHTHDNGDGDEMYNIRGLTNVNFINIIYMYHYYTYAYHMHMHMHIWSYHIIQYHMICMIRSTCTHVRSSYVLI